MEINVAQLLKLPVGTTREFDVDEDVEGIEEPGSWSRIQGDVKLLRTREGILVRATLNTKVGCTCSRCLEVAECALQLQIEEEYYPVIDVSTGYPLEVPKDSIGFTISANHVLSLDEAIRQYVVLNQPMQPLCRPDCAGLCPECGANLNIEQCDCHLGAGNDAFAGLKELLDTENQDFSNDERS